MLDVDALAQEIRRVDGSNSLGAGALAEALMPFIARSLMNPQGNAVDAAANILAQADGYQHTVSPTHRGLASMVLIAASKTIAKDFADV
jgi:hypothetical protein